MADSICEGDDQNVSSSDICLKRPSDSLSQKPSHLVNLEQFPLFKDFIFSSPESWPTARTLLEQSQSEVDQRRNRANTANASRRLFHEPHI
jgi:hypothetical protein